MNEVSKPPFRFPIESLQRPPRELSSSLLIQLLFGGFLAQIGWLLFAFGMIFVWVFMGNADFKSRTHFNGSLEQVEGTVTRTVRTNFTESGSRHSNGSRIFANHYSFTSQEGQFIQSVSYSKGNVLSPDQPVTIEYPLGKPHISRIRGLRMKPFDIYVSLVVIFPFIGLIFVCFSLNNGRRAIRLLKHGTMTSGELISKKKTSMKVNNQPVYKLTYEFKDMNGRINRAFAKSHRTEALEDEEKERLLYDPHRPKTAAILDSLPGTPRIASDGKLKTQNNLAAVIVLIVPFFAAASEILFFYLRFIK